jgi:hypothetical protein
MTAKGWKRPFDDPIPLPDGRTLITLMDAADYITSLPKKETNLPDWQVAMQALLLVSRSGPTMLARIAVMKVLNRGYVREFNPDANQDHWGRKKLKRDE